MKPRLIFEAKPLLRRRLQAEALQLAHHGIDGHGDGKDDLASFARRVMVQDG